MNASDREDTQYLRDYAINWPHTSIQKLSIQGELWDDVDFHVFVPALRHCIRDIPFPTSQDIYQWTRYNGYSNLFSVMSVDGTLVDVLIEDGEVTEEPASYLHQITSVRNRGS